MYCRVFYCGYFFHENINKFTSCLERVIGNFSSASSSSNTGFDEVNGFWSSSFGCIYINSGKKEIQLLEYS